MAGTEEIKMPISTVIKLFPEKNTLLPPTMGRYAHAVFFEILKHSDSERAEEIHKSNVKPFTTSPLQGRFEKRGREILIREGTQCWMRYTLLDDSLFPVFSRYFLETPQATIRLRDGIFRLTGLLTSENLDETKWSGHATYEEMMETANTYTTIDVRFYSPTAFRERDKSGGKPRNFPGIDVMRCYQSWVKKWNSFAQMAPQRGAPTIDKDKLLLFVWNHGGLTRIETQSRMMDFGKHKQAGFVGKGQWQFREDWGFDPDEDDEMDYLPEDAYWAAPEPSPYPPPVTGPMEEEMLKQVNALADFAFYCGTGYKVTMGMGQTRRLQ